MPTFYPVPLAGTPITADFLTSMLPQLVEKTANQSVTNSTVNVNDTHLFFAVEANAVYTVEGHLLYSVRSDTDIEFGFTGPAGATLDWTCHGMDPAGSGVSTTSINVARQDIASTSFPLGGFGADNSSVLNAIIRGRLDTAGTAGTLNLTWSQRVANATAAIMQAGSWLKFTRHS